MLLLECLDLLFHTDHTTLVTEIALSFITFSVGGSLYLGRIRALGKTIIWVKGEVTKSL